MSYNPNKMDIHKDYPARKSIRLKGYDYSQAGLYFITICCQNRKHLFGNIIDGKMVLNDAGKMIKNVWYEIPNDFSNIRLHEYITMPNHIHGIIEIVDVGADSISAPISEKTGPKTGQKWILPLRRRQKSDYRGLYNHLNGTQQLHILKW